MANYTSDMLKELNEKGIRRVSFISGYFGKWRTMVRWNHKTKRAFNREDIPATVQCHLLDSLAHQARPKIRLSPKTPTILVRVNTATGGISTATGNHPYSKHCAYGGDIDE